MALLVGQIWMFGEPLVAMTGGRLLEAEFGEPLFGVEQSASNGGV